MPEKEPQFIPEQPEPKPEKPEESEKAEKKEKEEEKKISRTSHWEAKREVMLEGLDRRVEAVRKLKDTIETITLEQNHKEVATRLRDCFVEIQSSFPKTTINDFQESHRLEKEVKKVNIRMNKMEKEFGEYLINMKPEAEKEYEKLADRAGKMWDKYYRLCDNPDVEFLRQFEDIIKSLTKKNKYIKETTEDKAVADFIALKYNRKQGIDVDDVGEVSFGPFDIILNFKKPDKEKMAGRYFSGTPFIAIYEADKFKGPYGLYEKEITIRHEKIHNILDSVGVSRALFGRSFDRFKQQLDERQILKEQWAPLPIIENSEKMLRKIKPFHFIDEQYGEIIAAIEAARGTGFKRFSPEEKLAYAIYGRPKKEKISPEKEFYQTTSAFATAGGSIIKISKYLKEKADKTDDDQMKKFLLELKKNTEQSFVKMVESIKDADEVSRLLGQEAREKVDTLFLILRPTQYRHIRGYLEHVYGKELIERRLAEENEREKTIYEFDFAFPSLKKLIKNLEEGTLKVDEEDKKFLLNAIENFDSARNYGAHGIRSMDDVKEYLTQTQRLLELLGDTKPFKGFSENVKEGFFYWFLDTDIANQFQDVPEMWDKLTTEEKKHFKGILSDYMDADFFEEYFKKTKISSLQEIKKLPLWEVIKQIGMEGEISEIIEEIIEENKKWREAEEKWRKKQE